MVVPDVDRTAPLVLPELVGTLALATDLAMDHPLEMGLGSCLLALGAAERLGLDADGRNRVFHLTLLRHIGCTTDSSALAHTYGDEIRLAGALTPLGGGTGGEYLRAMARFAVAGRRPVPAVRALGRVAVGVPRFPAYTGAVCDVARTLAGRLGLGPDLVDDVGAVFERWDGAGLPSGRSGVDIPATVRIAQVADLVTALHDLGHPDPLRVVGQRAGAAFDPDVVAAFRQIDVARTLDVVSRWDAVQARRPAVAPMSVAEIDAGLAVIADFVDLKSPYLAGHSSGVSRLAARAAEHLGLGPGPVVDVRRAALVHDLGRVAVSSAVWDKRSALTAGEWEKVRLHPYHTGRLLDRVPFLARLGTIAAGHHERLDGSGYHRGAGASQLAPEARVLAAADSYHAMVEPRPHRPALDPVDASAELRAQVRAGRLDASATEAVLASAGHRADRRGHHAAGLTAREVQVLRLIAGGRSTRDVARTLVITPKTAGNHVTAIYRKVGVTSRAAATVTAMQHGLVDPSPECSCRSARCRRRHPPDPRSPTRVLRPPSERECRPGSAHALPPGTELRRLERFATLLPEPV